MGEFFLENRLSPFRVTIMKRREFISKTAVGTSVAAATTAFTAPNVIAAPKVRWKMVSTWPPQFPLFQTGLDRFAKRVEELSEGQFAIKVFAGGELVPALGAFDAVSKGTVESGAGAAYYWAGKSAATQWFTAVPFGLNAQGMNSWIYAGGGLKLWEDAYADFNLVPRPYGNTGVQMGGWFNKEINSIEDFQDLKMRIPGLGGKVVSKIGGTPILLAGGEIFKSLERGVIDAAEWVGPMHDLKLGFYKVAKYYYTPGWHEPGTVLEVFFNKKAYNKLPRSLQNVLGIAAAESNLWMLGEFDAQNGAALETLITQHNVKIRQFPEEVLDVLRIKAMEVREEEADKNPMAKKVHLAFNKFQEQVGIWGSVSERSYFSSIAKKYQFS